LCVEIAYYNLKYKIYLLIKIIKMNFKIIY
jgi:hypothetical protein